MAQFAVVEEYVREIGSDDPVATKVRADRVLAASEDTAGLSKIEYYELVLDIAKMRAEAGDAAGAEAAYRRAYAFGENAFGEYSLRLRAALQGIARAQRARGDMLGAEKTLLRSKAIAEEELGAEHPSTRDELAMLSTLRLPVKSAPNGEDRRGDYESSLLRIDARAKRAGEIVAQGAGDADGNCASAEPNAAQRVVVYYGTNRKLSGNNALTWFYKNDYDRGAPVKYGVVTVSLPCNREIGSIPTQQLWKLEFRANPAKHVILESLAPYSSEAAFWSSAKRRMDRSHRKEALVFIHGYNVDFAGAATRTAQLAADTDLDGAPFFYDWPSKAALGGYNADRTVATEIPQITRDVADFLKGVADRTGAERISIIAHSMGNEPLIRALKLLADEDFQARTDRPFDEVIFASPDVNVENFKSHVAATRRLAGNMTLYASERDRALEYSSWRSDFPRAGFAREKVVVEGLVSVDTTKASSNFIGHDDFAGNGLDDLRSIIWFGAKPEGRCILSPLPNPKGIWDFTPKCSDADFKLAVTLLRRRGYAQGLADLNATRQAAEADQSIAQTERQRRIKRADLVEALMKTLEDAFNPQSLKQKYASTNKDAATAPGLERALLFDSVHAPIDRGKAALANIDAAAATWRRHAADGGTAEAIGGFSRTWESPLLIEVQAQGDDPGTAALSDGCYEGKRLYNAGACGETVPHLWRARIGEGGARS